jgi:hypothetical protein
MVRMGGCSLELGRPDSYLVRCRDRVQGSVADSVLVQEKGESRPCGQSLESRLTETTSKWEILTVTIAIHSRPVESDSSRLVGRLPWATMICGVVGFTTPFTVQAAGNFPVAEGFLLFAAIASVAIRVIRHRWPDGASRTRAFTTLIVLQIIGLGAYVVSDIYRDSAPVDYLRGWARMAFVGIDIIGLAFLVGSSWRRFVVIITGWAFGQVACALIFGPLFDDWWKFGFAEPVTFLALIAVGRKNRLPAAIVAIALGILHILLEFRSLGLECLMVAISLYLIRLPRLWRFAAVFAVLAAIGLALSGLFDERVQKGISKHLSDAERRAMMEVAAESFADSPIIGQGSWFSTGEMRRRIEERYIALSETFNGYTEEQEHDLAIHSQLLTALAEGGIFGASFFIAYGFLLMWALAYCLRSTRPQQAIVLMILIEGLWNLAIAPFSGPARVQIAAAAVLCLLLWQQARGRVRWEDKRN